MKNRLEDFDHHFIEICYADLKVVFVTEKTALLTKESNVHMHSFWEMFYIQEGELFVETDQKSFFVKEGQMMLMPPDLYHYTKPAPGTRKISVLFAFEKVKSFEKELFDEIYRVFPAKDIYIEDSAHAGVLMEKFFENDRLEKSGREWRVNANAIDLIFFLYDSLKEKHFTPFQKGEQLMGYWNHRYAVDTLLSRNYEADISQDALSKMIGISSPSLTRVLASGYGKSFGSLKTELKMLNAKRLLRETKLSIGEIGTTVGYTTARGFLFAFHRSEGCTPSEYRKKLREEKS